MLNVYIALNEKNKTKMIETEIILLWAVDGLSFQPSQRAVFLIYLFIMIMVYSAPLLAS